VLCGTAWFDACFAALDPATRIAWHAHDGERVAAARPCAKSAARPGAAQRRAAGPELPADPVRVATETRRYVNAVAGTRARIYDTRKTLPGLRLALKYAVKCGGGENQRIGCMTAF